MTLLAARRPAGTHYGRIITGADVEDHARHTLREHLPRYVAQVEHQEGRKRGTLTPPRAYIRASEFTRQPEDQLPCVVLVSPGWADRPQRAEEGELIAEWLLATYVVVSTGGGDDLTRDQMQIYLHAAAACLAGHESLGGLACGLDLIDLDYDAIQPTATRSLSGGLVACRVKVEDVLTYGGGGFDPALEDWPVTEKVEIDMPPARPTHEVPTLTLEEA